MGLAEVVLRQLIVKKVGTIVIFVAECEISLGPIVALVLAFSDTLCSWLADAQIKARSAKTKTKGRAGWPV